MATRWFNDNLCQLTSSGKKTSSAVIKGSAGVFGGVLIGTDGTNDATIKIFDNASEASGKQIWEQVVPASDRSGGGSFNHVVQLDNGCYLSIAGTGAFAFVSYY